MLYAGVLNKLEKFVEFSNCQFHWFVNWRIIICNGILKIVGKNEIWLLLFHKVSFAEFEVGKTVYESNGYCMRKQIVKEICYGYFKLFKSMSHWCDELIRSTHCVYVRLQMIISVNVAMLKFLRKEIWLVWKVITWFLIA